MNSLTYSFSARITRTLWLHRKGVGSEQVKLRSHHSQLAAFNLPHRELSLTPCASLRLSVSLPLCHSVSVSSLKRSLFTQN